MRKLQFWVTKKDLSEVTWEEVSVDKHTGVLVSTVYTIPTMQYCTSCLKLIKRKKKI